MNRLLENLNRVRERIAQAAARSGRGAEAVRLIAVTKYVDLETTCRLLELGCAALGESRPQQLWNKAEELAATTTLPREWHLIGHLQRNKTARTVAHADWIHSVDSLRLLEELDRQATAQHRRPNVLLEVNVSGQAAKHGFHPTEMEQVVAELGQFKRIAARGLMTMAGAADDLNAARREFAALRQLAEQLSPLWPEETPLEELSMGMSGDFEIAIEEGATMVRIGSALFEGV